MPPTRRGVPPGQWQRNRWQTSAPGRSTLASRASRHHSLRVNPSLLATASRSLNSSSLTFVLRVLVRNGGFTMLHRRKQADGKKKNGTAFPHELPKESIGLRA